MANHVDGLDLYGVELHCKESGEHVKSASSIVYASKEKAHKAANAFKRLSVCSNYDVRVQKCTYAGWDDVDLPEHIIV